jgi:hypothetical protein
MPGSCRDVICSYDPRVPILLVLIRRFWSLLIIVISTALFFYLLFYHWKLLWKCLRVFHWKWHFDLWCSNDRVYNRLHSFVFNCGQLGRHSGWAPIHFKCWRCVVTSWGSFLLVFGKEPFLRPSQISIIAYYNWIQILFFCCWGWAVICYLLEVTHGFSGLSRHFF